MFPRLPTATPDRRERVRELLAPVSPLGWGVLASAGASWIIGWSSGWVEFCYAAGALVILILLSGLLTIGRTPLDVSVRVSPRRLACGDSAVAEVRVRNRGRLPLPPLPLEVPTGSASIATLTPLLGPGAVHEELVVLPTGRRGVYPIGPVTTLRGDPFGLVRRAVQWTEPVELFVYPRTVHLDAFTTGVLRDLEGHTTDDVSAHDLAFHGLREYVPGDDGRHIHWLSTARRNSTGDQTGLIVRQYLDTRRTHIALVVDSCSGSYGDADDFESILEIGASVATRAMRDNVELTVGCGQTVLKTLGRTATLDLFARAELGPERVDLIAGRLARSAPNASTVVIVTGPLGPVDQLGPAIAAFTPGSEIVLIRFVAGAPVQRQRGPGATLVTLGHVNDLGRALSGRPSA